MEIKNELPPNFNRIKEVLNPPDDAVFAYGDIIFNPSGGKIPEDIILHEEVHQKQQKLFGTPELWWVKYLKDTNFRLIEEVEAYAAQYNFIKGKVPNKILKVALQELANNLIEVYNIPDITFGKAQTLIRKYAQKAQN